MLTIKNLPILFIFCRKVFIFKKSFKPETKKETRAAPAPVKLGLTGECPQYTHNYHHIVWGTHLFTHFVRLRNVPIIRFAMLRNAPDSPTKKGLIASPLNYLVFQHSSCHFSSKFSKFFKLFFCCCALDFRYIFYHVALVFFSPFFEFAYCAAVP